MAKGVRIVTENEENKSVNEILTVPENKEKNKDLTTPKNEIKNKILAVPSGLMSERTIVEYFKVLIPNEAHHSPMRENEMFDKINALCHEYKVKDRVRPGCGGKHVSDVMVKIIEAYNGR